MIFFSGETALHLDSHGNPCRTFRFWHKDELFPQHLRQLNNKLLSLLLSVCAHYTARSLSFNQAPHCDEEWEMSFSSCFSSFSFVRHLLWDGKMMTLDFLGDFSPVYVVDWSEKKSAGNLDMYDSASHDVYLSAPHMYYTPWFSRPNHGSSFFRGHFGIW